MITTTAAAATTTTTTATTTTDTIEVDGIIISSDGEGGGVTAEGDLTTRCVGRQVVVSVCIIYFYISNQAIL